MRSAPQIAGAPAVAAAEASVVMVGSGVVPRTPAYAGAPPYKVTCTGTPGQPCRPSAAAGSGG